VSEAYSRTELLEQMAEIYYRARAAGEPVILTAAEVAEVVAKIRDYGQSKPLAVRDS
jgi:L-fuculose-phosphate aldolase